MAIKRMLVDLELANGKIVEAYRLTNRARIAAELEANKRGWPPPDKSMALRTTFAIYEQLRVDDEYDGDFKTFRESVLVDFDVLEEDEQRARGLIPDVDPTPPATAEDYASQSPPQPD